MTKLRDKLARLHHRTTLADRDDERAPFDPDAAPSTPAEPAAATDDAPGPCSRQDPLPSTVHLAPPRPGSPFGPEPHAPASSRPPARTSPHASPSPRPRAQPESHASPPASAASRTSAASTSGRASSRTRAEVLATQSGRGRVQLGADARTTGRSLTDRAFAAWRAARDIPPPVYAVPVEEAELRVAPPEMRRTAPGAPPRPATPPTEAARPTPGVPPPAPAPAPSRTASFGSAISERLSERRGPCAHLSEQVRGRFRATPSGTSFSVEDRVPLSTRLGHARLDEGLLHADRVPRLAGGTGWTSFTARRALFLDLETTGLRAADGHIAFIVGLAALRDDDLAFELVTAHDPSEERATLERALARIERCDCLVTFNGARFDLPFLRARLERWGLPTGALERPHLDLYRASRRWLTGLPNRRQVTHEEELLGFRRAGDLPGSEAPARFARAQATGDASHLLEVLEHNRLDLAAMVPLVGRLAALVAERPTNP